jgi:hypothetical protein
MNKPILLLMVISCLLKSVISAEWDSQFKEIQNKGYTPEQYSVETEDGWTLNYFRIKNAGKPPVMLHHG